MIFFMVLKKNIENHKVDENKMSNNQNVLKIKINEMVVLKCIHMNCILLFHKHRRYF